MGVTHRYNRDSMLRLRTSTHVFPASRWRACAGCNARLPILVFRWVKQKNGTKCLYSYCDPCHAVRQAKGYSDNPAKHRARYEKACEERPEAVKQWRRNWRLNNGVKVRLAEKKYREMRRAAFVERIIFQVVWDRDRGTCQICGNELDPSLVFPDWGYPTIDHIIPLSKGGKHAYTNVQLACWGCNHSKRDFLPDL